MIVVHTGVGGAKRPGDGVAEGAEMLPSSSVFGGQGVSEAERPGGSDLESAECLQPMPENLLPGVEEFARPGDSFAEHRTEEPAMLVDCGAAVVEGESS